MIDDLLAGVAPTIQKNALQLIQTLKDRGYTLIMAESTGDHIQHMADRLYYFQNGLLHDNQMTVNC
ncbi:hypothetical protein L1889_09490 [Paenalcaligenes niemegkensis]|uniref:hypothetical protein n=1 Tax=Paenalcaligenes niemegkensis TaxID=2895469 RepID=UPI001EE86D26|nr:hypothetical protein [Paenalcaligenes niemegkensis]MCQ9616907.1 hypothetical protein [Paenalcaligenes niemegkensis]